MPAEASGYVPPPEIPTDRPTPSRAYGWLLGGKDHFPIDRVFVHAVLKVFPECLDIARENRRFLYRAVRYLAAEAGIRQFLDLGSGYPSEHNVHQVAHTVQPEARVVYVDHDPLVLAHGRALLADNPHTTVITADITEPEQVLAHPDTQRLIDFAQPVALLLFSIPHCIPDDEAAYRAIWGPLAHAAPGSFLALSHVVADEEATAERLTATITGLGMPWKTRTAGQVAAWLEGVEPIDPGLVDINTWRPDPTQPPLSGVPAELRPYLHASRRTKRVYEYGGLLRKP